MPDQHERAPDLGASSDGRVARRERNQSAVVDAYIELVQDGTAVPTPEDLAARANVSVRSIYRYFDDRSSLLAEVAERVIAASTPLLADDLVGVGDLEQRIESFVTSRLDVHERTAVLSRVGARHHATDPAVMAAFDRIRVAMRTQIDQHFSAELDGIGTEEREALVVEMHVPFLIDGLDYACKVLGENRERVAAMLRNHLRRILTMPTPTVG